MKRFKKFQKIQDKILKEIENKTIEIKEDIEKLKLKVKLEENFFKFQENKINEITTKLKKKLKNEYSFAEQLEMLTEKEFNCFINEFKNYKI